MIEKSEVCLNIWSRCKKQTIFSRHKFIGRISSLPCIDPSSMALLDQSGPHASQTDSTKQKKKVKPDQEAQFDFGHRNRHISYTGSRVLFLTAGPWN